MKLIKQEGMFPDGGNLYLRVTAAARNDVSAETVLHKYWVFRYASRANRKDRQYGIGPLHDISLAAAREKAHQLRLKLRDGCVDLLDEKRSQEASNAVENAKGLMAFDACRDAYIAAHEASWSNEMHRT